MDRRKYMTTGEVANVMHVTKNTLFHYDKIGLFSPELKLDNDYRLYSTRQLEVLEAILWLRELDMPLEDIRRFLKDRTPRKLLELFEVEEKLAAAQMKRLRDRMEWMREKKKEIEELLNLDLDGIYMKKMAKRYYIIDDVGGGSEQEFAKSVGNLITVYGESNDSMCYDIAYIQDEEDIKSGVYDNYRNVALLTSKKPKALKWYEIVEGDYLLAYHRGHWESIGEAYVRLITYAKEQRLKLCGDFVERYVIDNLASENEEEFVTEISVRVDTSAGAVANVRVNAVANVGANVGVNTDVHVGQTWHCGEKPKAVVFDLDGTLLDSAKQITSWSKEALYRLTQKGVMVVIATGRPLSALPSEIMEMDSIRYLITSNGAVIYDKKERGILRQTSIPRGIREKVFAACEEEDIAFEALIGGQAYSEARFLGELENWSVRKESMKYLKDTRKGVEDITRLVLRSEKVEGIGIRLRRPEQEQKIRERLKTIPGIYVTTSVQGLVEVAEESTNKCRALEELLKREGLSLENAAAFGDADNDVEMLTSAGVGIAMENGSSVCKEAADFVTKSNDTEGISYALEHILKLI